MNDQFYSRRAVARAIPDTFPDAVVQAPPTEPIRVDVARRQHHAYLQALEELGLSVNVLPAVSAFPDCCFVEDCAVQAEGVALITLPGAPSRRGEEQAVSEALRPHVRLEQMATPATADGGDCLRIGKRWYVGRSGRTNAAGVQRLREVFCPIGFEVVEVPVGRHLHLKSVCSYLGDGWLLLAEGTVPPEVFHDVRILWVPSDERYAANCLSVNGSVLLSAGFPATRRALEATGQRVRELQTSEIRKADGSLTCLSIVF